uniref:C2H2-type domain-containing protein n=1 Tax=Heterorhabditis bacteriophora TaxID=37862 RepID=A0A1I7XPV3_HETBA
MKSFHTTVFRKYCCGSCSNTFYTEEDREQHCRNQNHVHSFGMKVNQYNEMLVCQFLKDTEYLAFCDIDNLIILRSKTNLALNELFGTINKTDALKNTPKKSGVDTRDAKINGRESRYTKKNDNKSRSRSRSPSKSGVSHSSKKKENKISRNIGTLSKELSRYRLSENEAVDTESSDNSGPHSHSQVVIPNSERIRNDENSISGLSPAVEIIGDALRTYNEETKCILCKQMIPSDYLVRKDHVSRRHMPPDHNEKDYVEVLEIQMMDAFPGLVNSDIQCQINNCKKTYKSQGSRRKHVARVHFCRELNCPFGKFTGCTFASSAILRVNQHLKLYFLLFWDNHGLREGYRSIDNAAMKYDFGVDRTKHNASLDLMVRKAFPCPIPEFYKNRFTQSSEQTFEKLMDNFREKNRRFQDIPPAPLRRRSPSSSSSSSDDGTLSRGRQLSETSIVSATESKTDALTAGRTNQIEAHLRKGDISYSLDMSYSALGDEKNENETEKSVNENIKCGVEKKENYECQSFPSYNSDHESLSSLSKSSTSRTVKIEDPTLSSFDDFSNREDNDIKFVTNNRKDKDFKINGYYKEDNREELTTFSTRRTLLTTPAKSTTHRRTLLTTPKTHSRYGTVNKRTKLYNAANEAYDELDHRYRLSQKPNNYRPVRSKEASFSGNNTVVAAKIHEKRRRTSNKQIDRREIRQKLPMRFSNSLKTPSTQVSRRPNYTISKIYYLYSNKHVGLIFMVWVVQL